MKGQVLWKVSVTAPEQIEGAVAELLSDRFGRPASIFTDLKTGKTTIAVYLDRKPDWSMAYRTELSAALKRIDPESSRSTALSVRLTRLKNEDWSESWKRHFKPMAIGRCLLISPSWSRRRPKAGQALVQLDPGMSFGTGQHPTTGFCLRELVRFRKPGTTQSFLDIGTGSGILAICAAKLGYSPVDALDFDPDCVKIARSNAALNGVGKHARIRSADVASLPRQRARQYAVVCANLMANLLLEHKVRITAAVEAGGHLVVAGILEEEFPRVQGAYESIGLELRHSRREKEWRSGSFRRVLPQ